MDALLSLERNRFLRCSKCDAPATLRLKFDFGLNAPDSECTVLDCFVPRRPESWKATDEANVTFYPFLVIVQRHGRNLAVWLPYWHVVERGGRVTQKKYGQWAPFMDFHLFKDLLDQAQAKGYSSKLEAPPVVVVPVDEMTWHRPGRKPVKPGKAPTDESAAV